ncbi:unnamed protein product [Nezara viridula]|uniref:G-protein coupled receptors family 2 profile 2 domain-containing protein n=1 Tax=Nezara viridula TaxID=85310 RepID=A0A9P0H6R1_NEZVI|nr:unnamed protein product [Nezara viridula]
MRFGSLSILKIGNSIPRWLLLCSLNISVTVGEIFGDVESCGPDVVCEGKTPEKNPEYFKPTMSNLHRCYCDEECVKYGDCCKDRAPFPYSPVENITWSCVANSYNQTFYAVSNCMIKEPWNRLCQKEVYVSHMEYVSDLPVFSNYTGLYYANVFCAYCDPRLWLEYGHVLANYFTKPELLTECTPNININTLMAEGQYIPRRLSWKVRDGYCGIFQKEEIERGRPCIPSISSCPVGTEKSLSDKCAAYSQLLSINDTVFRNPHCAICNGVDQSHSLCKYKKPTIKWRGITDIFSLNWFVDSCQEKMHLRDNLHQECKAVNCDLVSGKCHINECDDTCHPKGYIHMSGYLMYACLSASIICLLIHVYRAIFICPPRNLPSRILNSLAWSMLIAQTLFLTSMYSLARLPHHVNLCYITAVTIQYFFLASFMWMSVISFDIWFTFSNTFQLISTSYTKYAIYAWGGTAIMTTFSVIIDLTDFFPSDFRPEFGPVNNICWLGSYNGLAYYSLLPIGTVLFLNTVFFIMTICLSYWKGSRGGGRGRGGAECKEEGKGALGRRCRRGRCTGRDAVGGERGRDRMPAGGRSFGRPGAGATAGVVSEATLRSGVVWL